MDFQEIRKEYELAGIVQAEMLANPIDTFKNWCDVAVEKCPGGWFEANAMALATTDASGNPTVRMVLLKGIDANGIRFYTNYDSVKGKQIEENPRAAIVLHWPYLGRQVRLEGVVTKTTREDSTNYFHSRPRGSQLGAAASLQSTKIDSLEALALKREELEKQYEGQEVPLPENWGGYLITPNRFEFWQGRLDRLHDRFVYQAEDDSAEKKQWETFRISP